MPNTFGSRLNRAFANFGHLCVGIDPHPEIMDAWGLPDSASGLAKFSSLVLEACESRVGIIKPQVAFYERHGSAGFVELEKLAAKAQEQKLLVIMDAKRGDIGSTMDGYFDAWLGQNAPFLADALTVSPYLGVESLLPTLSRAHERGKGVFVLAATSNPEAKGLQAAKLGSGSVANDIWLKLGAANAALDGDLLGSFGAVIGATIDPISVGISLSDAPTTPILAPGFGAQGALLTQLSRLYGEASARTIANVSRSVLQDGPLGIEKNIDDAVAQLKQGGNRVD